jgi:uncharacterized protein
MLQELYSIHHQVVRSMSFERRRYLYDLINWDNQCICIRGARGVGKTALLIQHQKNDYASVEQCLYLSGDNILVVASGLYQTIRDYFARGGETVIVDEIHKYPNWAQELKNCVDTYRDRRLLVSGSSSLDLTRASYDLSRRVVYYDLPGLSFREYLAFRHGIELPVLTLREILEDHVDIAAAISGEFPVLRRFDEYLAGGYYPYFLEGEEEYPQKVMNSIEKVLFEDIAVTFNLTQAKLPTLKRILWLVATSNPFVPNIAGMSRDLGISKEYVYNYLEFLERAGLITTLRAKTGAPVARKPGKIYFENTNLLFALNGSLHKESLVGSSRETFFANQLGNAGHGVSLHAAVDFLVDERYAFEIGGRSKRKKQARGLAESYRALAGIDIGAGERIPLYLFGFLY